MKSRLHEFWHSMRLVLIGWLVVALLLPTLLGLTSSAAAAHANSFSEICSVHNANLPGDHKKHSEDCPCCVLASAGHAALPARDAVELVIPQRSQVAVFLAQATSLSIAETYAAHALARGPPEPLII